MAKQKRAAAKKSPAKKRPTQAAAAKPTNAARTGVTKSRSKPIMLPTEHQIRLRAYEVYLRRGGAPGDAAGDWDRAERELLDELATK